MTVRSCAPALCPFDWAVAVLASREHPGELLDTVQALHVASIKPTVIDVLVNGNRQLATFVCTSLHGLGDRDPGVQTRVWFFALGDKANTWNQYVHGVWPGGALTFFVDGYARVAANALELLERTLSSYESALAATGIPSLGRSAPRLRRMALQEGYLHGNLFVLRRTVMDELRIRGIRLPLGLYGYDGLIGAMLAFGLDPSQHEWNMAQRVAVSLEATWTHDEKKWWRVADVKAHIHRIRKQALRQLVVSAVRDFFAVQKRLPEQLPRTLAELVIAWANQRPDELRTLLVRSPLSGSALAELKKLRDWSAADRPPELLSGGQVSR